MEDAIWFIMLGLVAGVLSGLIGIGGGVLIVPALVFLFGFSQHQTQGTRPALMVPPIGLLGARVATGLAGQQLEKLFGVILLLIALRMIFGR